MAGKYIFFLLFPLILNKVDADCTSESPMWQERKREHHPCIRPCVEGKPMTCHYHFAVDMYYSMSKACYNCPSNMSDCYRKECIHVDGFEKTLFTANRKVPGPTIEVCHGDKIIVNVQNDMNDETTSIHWHGMLQFGTQYMDGVPMITQCPIPPGDTFTYTFWAHESGTHLWHGHTGIQRVDGLFGAIIVRQQESKKQREMYDEDKHVLIMNDWSHTTGGDNLMKYLYRGGSNGADTILCNGRGRYYKDMTQVSHTPLEVFHVKKGKRFRIRAISSGSYDCPVAISIDNHTLTAVATDGNEIKPAKVESIVFYAGERFDFVIHANQLIGNYWIRFTGLMHCKKTKAHNVAILHYEGADCSEPTAAIGYTVHPIPTMELNSLNVARNTSGTINIPDLSAPYNRSKEDSMVLKPQPDVRIVLPYDFYKIDNPFYQKKHLYGVEQVNASMVTYTPQFQHVSFKMPNVPPLSQPCDVDPELLCDNYNLTYCATNYCECTKIYKLDLYSVVELILIDIGETFNANHPFHLHGHTFRVVAMDKCGESTTVDFVRKLDEEGYLKRNLIDAPYKDTVTVPDGGYTVLRFLAKNPGVWLFHCHLDFHIEIKMAVLFQVGEVKEFPPVPHNFRKCGPIPDHDTKKPCTLAYRKLNITNFSLSSKLKTKTYF